MRSAFAVDIPKRIFVVLTLTAWKGWMLPEHLSMGGVIPVESKSVCVVLADEIADCPPALMVCKALLSLGFEVTLVAESASTCPIDTRSQNFRAVDLSPRHGSRAARLLHDFSEIVQLRRFLRNHGSDYDLIWTIGDATVARCGRILSRYCHVMHLLELSKGGVPLISTRDSFPLKTKLVSSVAQNAHCVVVPELNRAYIQQAWWRLSKRPEVLPNKSLVAIPDNAAETEVPYLETLRNESRRVLLYQGVFSEDRDFSSVIEAMDVLGKEYVLYLVGLRPQDWARLEEQRNGRDNVVLVPFVRAPFHLTYTQFGDIGLLPYTPLLARKSRQTPLNALYCAPNKIWEYSQHGMPMIGSNVPGLVSLFSSTGMGRTCDISDRDAFVSAVREIEAEFPLYSARSKQFFDSIDIEAIVSQIVAR